MCKRKNPAIEALGYPKESLYWKIKNKIRFCRGYKKDKNGIRFLETWTLCHHLTEYLYPRLKSFKELDFMGYPVFLYDEQGERYSIHGREDATELWRKELGKMERAFFLMLEEDNAARLLTEEEQKEIERGLRSFAYHYRDLWD